MAEKAAKAAAKRAEQIIESPEGRRIIESPEGRSWLKATGKWARDHILQFAISGVLLAVAADYLNGPLRALGQYKMPWFFGGGKTAAEAAARTSAVPQAAIDTNITKPANADVQVAAVDSGNFMANRVVTLSTDEKNTRITNQDTEKSNLQYYTLNPVFVSNLKGTTPDALPATTSDLEDKDFGAFSFLSQPPQKLPPGRFNAYTFKDGSLATITHLGNTETNEGNTQYVMGNFNGQDIMVSLDDYNKMKKDNEPKPNPNPRIGQATSPHGPPPSVLLASAASPSSPTPPGSSNPKSGHPAEAGFTPILALAAGIPIASFAMKQIEKHPSMIINDGSKVIKMAKVAARRNLVTSAVMALVVGGAVWATTGSSAKAATEAANTTSIGAAANDLRAGKKTEAAAEVGAAGGGIVGGMLAGAAFGAITGVETGPGVIATTIVGGVVGAFVGEKGVKMAASYVKDQFMHGHPHGPNYAALGGNPPVVQVGGPTAPGRHYGSVQAHYNLV